VPERCDIDKMKGVYPSKIHGRNDYADLAHVTCNHEDEEHIAADQIFPLIKTGQWYTPTIKHHCPRTALASSLRACSNKVWYDQRVFEQYASWFRRCFIPKFMDCLSQELWTVDLDTWLKRYPLGYRVNAKESISRDKQTTLGDLDFQYEAFTKVEMQFTTVPHDLKETSLNDTKERQICGPKMEKKVYANPFINILEEVATKYFKPYCGRANWLQICESLENMESELADCIWGASDGSGFDMTQYPAMNELMNELMEKSAYHPNVHWNEPLSIDRFLEVIRGSITLHVSLDRGDLNYQAVGRASGDGWTTFGNTMLMASYWMFTFHKANIDCYGLKVKGDDVLFCLNKHQLGRFQEAVKYVFTDRKDEHCHGLGQICKKIDYGPLTDLDFLSNEFFLTSQGKYRMTRIPARIIQTNSWTTRLPKNNQTFVSRQELCYSKGKCLKAWADGLPIFSKLADKMIELGRPGKLSSYDPYADEFRIWHQGRDDREAYLYYLNHRYRITGEEVLQIEKKIDRVTTLYGLIDVPELERLYEVPVLN